MTVVQAGPTKRFFVSMLTRDIDLADAILDLLDNCVDGIMREKGGALDDGPQPYAGFRATIEANKDFFRLTDNCGGIPREVAASAAFRLGRDLKQRDENLATVGMYGIGMKRAMFKMGRHSTVTSQPAGQAYFVDIPPDWLDDDNRWTLEMVDTDQRLGEDGTEIHVRELHDSIAFQFDKTRSAFLGDLEKEISRLYALIINKGFQVRLNGDLIKPVDLDILFPTTNGTGPVIEPYVYKDNNDGVDIELVVGFYRPLATERELDAERQSPRSRDHAGWTVICNDRVVLHNDKTLRTGWGRGNVPNYHNQFISIAGVVIFRSSTPWKLPLNTTKRGLDADSLVYLQTLDIMQEGLKKFTDFTNKWKGREEETGPAFTATAAVRAIDVPALVGDEQNWIKVRKTGGRKLVPNLPLPAPTHKRKRIAFTRDEEEVIFLATRLFADEDANPADVGLRCWEDRLAAERR